MQITSGRLQKAIKCVVYGPEGIGKSTFATQAPNVVFCDVEESTTHMDVRRLPKATSYQMVLDEIEYIYNNPHLCDTFVLDTGDWVERLSRENVCAKHNVSGIEDFGYGKGYTYVYEEFGKILNSLDSLTTRGINIIINCHAVMRKFEQPDEMGAYDRWELKLINSPKCSISNMVKEWADMVLFANYETFVVQNKDKKNKAQGGKRVMHTTHHPCWDAKNRFGLEEKLPFDFAQVAHLFVSKSTTNNTKPVDQAMQEPQMPKIIEADDDFPFDVEIPNGIPKALADLMRNHVVSEKELTTVVAQRGYFPADMSLSEYPIDFINGVLIAAWDQVHNMVKENRKN